MSSSTGFSNINFVAWMVSEKSSVDYWTGHPVHWNGGIFINKVFFEKSDWYLFDLSIITFKRNISEESKLDNVM